MITGKNARKLKRVSVLNYIDKLQEDKARNRAVFSFSFHWFLKVEKIGNIFLVTKFEGIFFPEYKWITSFEYPYKRMAPITMGNGKPQSVR